MTMRRHVAMFDPRSRHAASARMPRAIRSEVDLIELIELPHSGGFFHLLRKPPVRLELPMLSAHENAAWQDRLDQLQQECGCRAAAAGLAAFVLAGIAWVLFAALQPNRGEAPDYSVIGMYSAAFVAGLILCTLLGKLAGLALAHVRYRRTCRALLQALQKPGSEYSFPPCTPSVSTLTCVTSRPLADKCLQSSRG